MDLEKLPRRMPYTVPEGTFDAIEQAVFKAIAEEKQAKQAVSEPAPAKRTRRMLPWLGGAVAMAAAVIWAVITFAPVKETVPPAASAFDEVSLAFEKLSPSDQEFILSVYQDDVYMNF